MYAIRAICYEKCTQEVKKNKKTKHAHVVSWHIKSKKPLRIRTKKKENGNYHKIKDNS